MENRFTPPIPTLILRQAYQELPSNPAWLDMMTQLHERYEQAETTLKTGDVQNAALMARNQAYCEIIDMITRLPADQLAALQSKEKQHGR